MKIHFGNKNIKMIYMKDFDTKVIYEEKTMKRDGITLFNYSVIDPMIWKYKEKHNQTAQELLSEVNKELENYKIISIESNYTNEYYDLDGKLNKRAFIGFRVFYTDK